MVKRKLCDRCLSFNEEKIAEHQANTYDKDGESLVDYDLCDKHLTWEDVLDLVTKESGLFVGDVVEITLTKVIKNG